MALVTTFLTVPLVTYIYPPKYHDKQEEDAGRPMHKNAAPPEPSILVSVNKIEQVPSILSVIDLIESKYKGSGHGTEDKNPKGTVIEEKSTKSPSLLHLPTWLHHSHNKGGAVEKMNQNHTSKLVVNALRLIEITERDSSVMLQTSSEALRHDPVMKMLQTFCEITALDIRGLIKVVTIKNFADTINKTAVDVNASYIIVPWVGSGSLLDEHHSSPVVQQFRELRRQQSMHTPVRHSNFIQELLTSAESAVLILVDRGLELVNSNKNSNEQRLVPYYQRIFFPFFGGPDDRAALEIVLGISGLNAMINIVRCKMGTHNQNRNSSGVSESDLNSVGSGMDIISYPQLGSSGDSEDEMMLSKYFGTVEARDRHVNVTYVEVESTAPISTALRYMTDLSSKDLIIVGRGVSSAGASNGMRGADAERRKALGDVAESVMLSSCSASLLVVQARKGKAFSIDLMLPEQFSQF